MNLTYYWINIDNSVYRQLFMEKQFELFNIKNKRITAITPETLSDVINDNPPYFCGNSSCNYNNHNDCKFEYSCSSSHLEAIKTGYLSGDKYFIVCEDDIYFPFKINYENLIKSLPDDWEILQMMVLDKDANEQLKDIYNSSSEIIRFNPTLRLFSTGMYLINRKGAKRLIKLFMNNKNNKYDLTNNTQIKQADFLLYMNAITYTSTFPYCFPFIKFVSEIHPSHYHLHLESINKINDNLKKWNYKNNYIVDYYPLEKFEESYILSLKEKKLLN